MNDSSNQHGVNGHFVLAQLQGAIQKGFKPEPILEKAGIDQSILTQPKQRVSFDQFASLMRITWQEMQDESAGYLAQTLKVGSFGMMCHATITSPNLRRALLRGARCFGLFTDDIQIELLENGPEAELRLSLNTKADIEGEYFVGSIALIWIRWASWMIDKKILLSRMNFRAMQPSYDSEYDDVFGCPIYYRQTHSGFVIPARYLDMPLAQNPQSLSAFLANTPRNLLNHYQKDDSLSGKIRRLLHSQLSQQALSQDSLNLEDTAKHLHLTSQTLRRRLREEGNAFQDIKDSVRKDIARHHLLRSDASINDIAGLMGFSEASVFHRAFKKWTGYTPGLYREMHQHS
jgi:AraC-like DNA-binding protein